MKKVIVIAMFIGLFELNSFGTTSRNPQDAPAIPAGNDEFVASSIYQGTISELPKVGDIIKKGNPLVKFDDVPINAQIASLKADIEATKILVKVSGNEFKRSVQLEKSHACSEKDFDTDLNTFEQAKSSLKMKESQLIILEDTKSSCIIDAPYDCKVTRVFLVVNSGTDIGQNILEIERL